MAVGQYKIGAIIQARLGSTRLPNKVLMPLPINSKNTIISHAINQLKKISQISKIIVATSTSIVNNKLEKYVLDLDIDCYRGDENDVLSRFYNIVEQNDFDYVLRLTGDNPVIDNDYLIEFIENCIAKELDYSCSKNLPIGCNFEIIKTGELIKAHKHATCLYDKEHVTPYIRKNAKNISYYNFETYKKGYNLRLTIDYPTDYAFMQIVFSKLKNELITLEKVNEIVAKDLWILDINKDNYQKLENATLQEEIQTILPIIKERDLNKLLKFLEDVN